MPSFIKTPERDAGGENVGNQHRPFRGNGRNADERERGEITGRAAVTDGGIKKRDRENGGEQDCPIQCRQVVHFLFAGIGGFRWQRAGFAEIFQIQINRFYRLHMAVIKKSVQTSVVARRIMRRARSAADKWQIRRARRRADAGIGAARRAAMIPHDESVAGLRDKTIALRGGTAGGIIHRVGALPLLLDGAFENGVAVGRAEK